MGDFGRMRRTKVRKHRRKTRKGVTKVRDHSRTLDFPKGRGNDIHIQIFVPSTELDRKIPQEKFESRIKTTKRFLSNLFGGYTAIRGTGGFTERNRLIQENVAVVETFAKRSDYLKHDRAMAGWLKKKKSAWKQISIGYSYNGKMYFV